MRAGQMQQKYHIGSPETDFEPENADFEITR